MRLYKGKKVHIDCEFIPYTNIPVAEFYPNRIGIQVCEQTSDGNPYERDGEKFVALMPDDLPIPAGDEHQVKPLYQRERSWLFGLEDISEIKSSIEIDIDNILKEFSLGLDKGF